MDSQRPPELSMEEGEAGSSGAGKGAHDASERTRSSLSGTGESSDSDESDDSQAIMTPRGVYVQRCLCVLLALQHVIGALCCPEQVTAIASLRVCLTATPLPQPLPPAAARRHVQSRWHGVRCRPLSKQDLAEESEGYKGWVRMTSLNVFGLFVFLLYLITSALYVAARCYFSLRGLGNLLGYGAFVLVVETLSILSLVFYGIWLCAKTSHADVRGKGGADGGMRRLYVVRVFILCKDEPLALVRRTIASVKNAYPTEGCERKLYLLDESKDPVKRDFFMGTKSGADVIYIAPPVRHEATKARAPRLRATPAQ
jgi:hypothetical protein